MPPHVFTGTVTVNGLLAPVGTRVTAFIDGMELAATMVSSDGKYVLLVPDPPSGRTIIFKVGDFFASQIAAWESGGAEVLNLTAIN